MNTYKERLYWHIRRIVMNHDDADDVLQNTFIKIFRSIDATNDDGSLGRLVNDSKYYSNCQMKKVDGQSLCLFAKQDIKAGEELRYFYGDENLPWHAEVCYSTLSFVKSHFLRKLN